MTHQTTNGLPIDKKLRALATFATAAMACVLGIVIAKSIMQAITPRIVTVVAEPATPAKVDISAAYSLFGVLAGNGNTSAPALAASTSAVILKGVFAVNGATLSAAIVNIGGKDKPMLVGEEIEAGLKLSEVWPDHIVLSRAGAKERVELAAIASSRGNQTAGTKVQANHTVPTNFRLNVNSSSSNNYSLSRQELNTSLQDPRQLGVLGRVGINAGGSGVRVEDAPAGSLSEKLGLRAGDIISSINGTPITGPGDMARLYQQFASMPQVRAEIKRGGTPMLLTYNIQ